MKYALKICINLFITKTETREEALFDLREKGQHILFISVGGERNLERVDINVGVALANAYFKIVSQTLFEFR